jgi:hypothetical protein
MADLISQWRFRKCTRNSNDRHPRKWDDGSPIGTDELKGVRNRIRAVLDDMGVLHTADSAEHTSDPHRSTNFQALYLVSLRVSKPPFLSLSCTEVVPRNPISEETSGRKPLSIPLPMRPPAGQELSSSKRLYLGLLFLLLLPEIVLYLHL